MNDRIRTVPSATGDFVVWSIVYQLKVLCCRLIKCVGIGGSVLKMERENVVTVQSVPRSKHTINLCYKNQSVNAG